MAIKLFDFQIEAVKRAIFSFYQLICVRTGGGKTIIAMTYANLLLKKNLSDKVVFACTVSASAAVHAEFEEKFDIDVPIYTETEQFLDFLRDSKKKICIIKHSMFEKLGKDQNIIDGIREILTDNKATITSEKDMGQRELAYEIKDFKSGFYYVITLEANDDSAINEFDRQARNTSDIVRHLITKIED